MAFAGLVLGVSSFANAGLIIFSENKDQITPGEDFTFIFSPALSSDGGEGILEFLIRGDFSIGASLGESFGFDIESVISETGIQATNSNLITSFDFDDNLFMVSRVISSADLTSILSDSSITVNVDFASGVNLNLSTASITTTIRYNDTTPVPEPSTLAIFALGLMGLASRRFMKKS